MKQFLPLLLAVCGFGGSAAAGPCLTGTLQDYINLGAGGCTLGTVTVSGFAIVPGQSFATPIDPLTVQVNPAGGYLSRLDLIFDAGAQAGDLLESFFRFQVAGAGLYTTGVKLAGARASGDGAVTSTLDTCSGSAFPGNQPGGCAGDSGSAVTIVTPGFSMLYDARTFPISSFFDVFADITVDGGPGGSAYLGRSTILIGATPEPSQVLLVLSGLAALAIARIRKVHAFRRSQ